MRVLSYLGGLAVANGATSPAGATGTVLWSTTENDWLYWNGSAWTNADAGAGGGVSDGDKGDVIVSGTGATWLLDPNVFGRSYLINTGRTFV